MDAMATAAAAATTTFNNVFQFIAGDGLELGERECVASFVRVGVSCVWFLVK